MSFQERGRLIFIWALLIESLFASERRGERADVRKKTGQATYILRLCIMHSFLCLDIIALKAILSHFLFVLRWLVVHLDILTSSGVDVA